MEGNMYGKNERGEKKGNGMKENKLPASEEESLTDRTSARTFDKLFDEDSNASTASWMLLLESSFLSSYFHEDTYESGHSVADGSDNDESDTSASEPEEGGLKGHGTKKNELPASEEELLKDGTSARTFDKVLGDEDSDVSTASWMLDDKIYEPDSSVAGGSENEVPNTPANEPEEGGLKGHGTKKNELPASEEKLLKDRPSAQTFDKVLGDEDSDVSTASWMLDDKIYEPDSSVAGGSDNEVPNTPATELEEAGTKRHGTKKNELPASEEELLKDRTSARTFDKLFDEDSNASTASWMLLLESSFLSSYFHEDTYESGHSVADGSDNDESDTSASEPEEGGLKGHDTKKNELPASEEELLKDRTSARTFDKVLGDEDSDVSTVSWMLDDKIYEPDSSVAGGSDKEVPNTPANELEEAGIKGYGTKKNESPASEKELLKDRTSVRTFDKVLGDEDSDVSTASWMLDDKIYEPDSSVADGSDNEVPNTPANELEKLKSKDESKKDETEAKNRSFVTRSVFIKKESLTASAVVESKDDSSSNENAELKSGNNKKIHAIIHSTTSYSTSDKDRTIRIGGPGDKKRSRRKMSTEEDLVFTNESEDSICEIPIPPKPQPLTVYLEDSSDGSSSSSSSSSDSETTDSETRLDKKSFLARESGAKNKGNNSISGNDGAANNPKDKDREEIVTLSDDDVVMSEVVGETVRKQAVDKSFDGSARGKGGKRNGKEDSLVSKNPNRSSSNAGAEGFVSAIRRVATEIIDKNDASKTLKNSTEDGELILNVAEGYASSSRIGNDNREEGRQARRSASRKRSIGESGRKSADDGSLTKRAKNFKDRAVPGTSKDNYDESRGKTRDRSAVSSFFKPMTNEMKEFYNKSWGGENFDVDAIRRRMPADPKQWEISNEDLLNSQRRRSRYWTTQMKCRNCNETGHAVAECTRQKKPPSCHMCGTSGHREPRCPDKHCLGCGRKQKTYTQTCNRCSNEWCNGCQSLGHEDNNCPDLWRRYHQTTSVTDINTDLNRADVMKPQHLLNCCNCARRGHDASTCASYRWSRHFPTPAYVTNYKTGPAYVHDPPPETERPKSSESEKLYADDNGDPCSSSSLIGRNNDNEKKEKKKRATDKITSAVVHNPGSTFENGEVERVEGSSKDRDQPELKESDERKEDSFVKTGTELIEDGEIFDLSVTSDLLDDEYMRKNVTDTCILPLSILQYEYLGTNDVGYQLLENLILRFPVGFKIRTIKSEGTESRIEMLIHSEPELGYAIRLTISGWLALPVDERSRFVKLTLPTRKKELVDILLRKLNELSEHLGDPKKIHENIQNLKSQLRSMQRQTKSGKKCGISSKRARVVEELANLQCRLNMIVVGQSPNRIDQKSYNYLRTNLIQMMKSDGQSPVDDSVYLRIHHHYDRIFSAYTNDAKSKYYLKEWKSEMKKPISDKAVFNIRKKGSKKSVSSNITNERNHNHSNDGMVKNIPSLVDPNVSFKKPDTNRGRYFNSNIIESLSPNRPSIRHDNGNINDDPDTWNVSYEPYDRDPKMNKLPWRENHFHQSNKDFGNNNGSSSCKVQGRDDYQTSTRNNNIEERDYISLTDNYDDRGLDWKTGDEIEKNTFHLDRVAGCSSSEDYRGVCDTMFAVGITSKDRRPRLPKTTDNNNKGDTCSKQKDENSNNNNSNNNNSGGGGGGGKSKKNKRKKNNSTALPRYLQERAAANIERYLKMDDPVVAFAAARLQKKFYNKNVTLRSICSFEKLFKRRTRIKVHLL